MTRNGPVDLMRINKPPRLGGGDFTNARPPPDGVADPSAHSRFAQRIRRRYAAQLPLLRPGAPDRTAIGLLFDALLKAGENPDLLVSELENPWVELAGSVLGDPTTYMGMGLIGKVGKAKTPIRMFGKTIVELPLADGWTCAWLL